MASTYVNDLRLNEMATGDQSGAWGTVTNTNLELIGDAFGYATEAITTNADTHATVIANGAADAGRAMVLKYTGTLDSACTITISGGDASTFTVSKLWYIHNATSGSQNIIITSGSGANITIANGQTKCVYTDGAGSGGAVIDTFAALSVVDLFVDDDLTVTDDLTVGGIVSLADGTAGAPSLTNTGDVNAGLFFSAADTLAFSAGGTAQFTMADGVIAPVTDSDVDLGTNSLRFKDVFIDSATVTGEVAAATLDISGAIDIAGNSVLASVDVTGLATAATFEPDGDTAAGDNAAIGYTAAEGLILTGQGSTNDVTIKNDADADVIEIPTGTTSVTMTGSLKPLTYQETYVASSAASTVTLDLATATSFSLTMDQATTFAFSNPPGSGTAFSFTLFLTQHSTAVAITWPGTVDWAGGSAPDAAAADALQAYAFFTRDGGTTYYGFLGGTAIA
jgi:hypothetical protein